MKLLILILLSFSMLPSPNFWFLPLFNILDKIQSKKIVAVKSFVQVGKGTDLDGNSHYEFQTVPPPSRRVYTPAHTKNSNEPFKFYYRPKPSPDFYKSRKT